MLLNQLKNREGTPMMKEDLYAIMRDRNDFGWVESVPLLDDEIHSYGDEVYHMLQGKGVDFIFTDPMLFSVVVIDADELTTAIIINEDTGEMKAMDLEEACDFDALYCIVDHDTQYWVDLAPTYPVTIEKILEMAV